MTKQELAKKYRDNRSPEQVARDKANAKAWFQSEAGREALARYNAKRREKTKARHQALREAGLPLRQRTSKYATEEERKQAIRESQRRYEIKRKAEKGITTRPKLTDEERRARHLANKKRYNDKVKAMRALQYRKKRDFLIATGQIVPVVRKPKEPKAPKLKREPIHIETEEPKPVKIDVQTKPFSNDEKRMIEEFLARKAS